MEFARQGMTTLEHLDFDKLSNRIIGMQRLEALFNQNGYLICQLSGEKIYDFDEIVAIFLPLSPSTDQVMAVHSNHATAFVQRCLLTLQ